MSEPFENRITSIIPVPANWYATTSVNQYSQSDKSRDVQVLVSPVIAWATVDQIYGDGETLPLVEPVFLNDGRPVNATEFQRIYSEFERDPGSRHFRSTVRTRSAEGLPEIEPLAYLPGPGQVVVSSGSGTGSACSTASREGAATPGASPISPSHSSPYSPSTNSRTSAAPTQPTTSSTRAANPGAHTSTANRTAPGLRPRSLGQPHSDARRIRAPHRHHALYVVHSSLARSSSDNMMGPTATEAG
ncbi:hypothetical protein [Kitasatospora sp. NPDC048407]|uniref:hypothetical protein n=1 Tax=Kitasatospora sp. NPDC048407 TaxID=3364051 RepID=UPI0037217D3D